MRPLKAAYNEVCAKWMKQYRPLKITQRDIAGLVKTAFQAICRMELANSWFAYTSYLLQKDILTDLDYVAAAHFSEENGAHNDTVPKTTTPSSGAPLDETAHFSEENGAHNDTVPKTTTPSSGAPLDETDNFYAASST
ncbi:hypothetical protein QE152_g21834 [Popillia japonica]|uniref:Uncharacterized protein n=1 Tax=Popillia japonica TaxID=7064 RepID=A0AAW1KKJ0_POPJA